VCLKNAPKRLSMTSPYLTTREPKLRVIRAGVQTQGEGHVPEGDEAQAQEQRTPFFEALALQEIRVVDRISGRRLVVSRS
jgi:hypothetical protein